MDGKLRRNPTLVVNLPFAESSQPEICFVTWVLLPNGLSEFMSCSEERMAPWPLSRKKQVKPEIQLISTF